MKSIYASKLYRASTRKERIQAALASPSNLGLVQQLADSLDEEFKTPDNLGIIPEEKPEQSDSILVDEEIDPEKDLVKVDDIDISTKGSKPHRSSTPSGRHDAPPAGGPEDKPDTATSELMPDSPATEEAPKEEKSAEASTKITSSTNVQINPVPAEALNLNVLKATLNGREDTAGVTRIAQKENEIWIYYKDEVNLNTIMTYVIEMLMNSAEYKNFAFNRLARSDNAIVFVVTVESYTYPEKSIESSEEAQQ